MNYVRAPYSNVVCLPRTSHDALFGSWSLHYGAFSVFVRATLGSELRRESIYTYERLVRGRCITEHSLSLFLLEQRLDQSCDVRVFTRTKGWLTGGTESVGIVAGPLQLHPLELRLCSILC